jgi:hypothetical protein
VIPILKKIETGQTVLMNNEQETLVALEAQIAEILEFTT